MREVYLHLNRDTGVGAYVDMNGDYIGGWKLSEKQIQFHLTYGTRIKQGGFIVGSYINVGMVSNDKMNVFINKCKEIIEKYCNISLFTIKFPIDNDCENWVEYVKNVGDIYEALDKCCNNEFAQCSFNFSTVDGCNITGTIMEVRRISDGNFGLLFSIPEDNFDMDRVDEIEKYFLTILTDSLKIGFDYAFCDSETYIEYTKNEILNKKISYSILVYSYNGKLYTKYANWKIDGLTRR